MNFSARAVLMGIVCALSFSAVHGVEQKAVEQKAAPLPSAKQILERYAKEIGGKEAFSRHRSQHVRGTVEMPAQKLSGKMEVFAARPNKLIMKVSMPGLGDVTTGYNGEVGWISTAITGPMLIEGSMIQEVATQADFDHALHDPADYKVMEVIGKEQFNDEECYKIRLVHSGGFESTEFFGVKSGLQHGFIATQQTQLGPVKATTLVKDYRKFGDLYMPSKTIQIASGIETVMTIEEMEFDQVEASVFDLSAEVKTLLDQKKKNSGLKKEENKGN